MNTTLPSPEIFNDLVKINMELPSISDLEKTVVSENESATEPSGKTISKREQKRLLKREKWIQARAAKRVREKEKVKKKKLEAKLNNTLMKQEFSRKALKNKKMSLSKCTVRVALDLSFDHLMNEKDIGKCIKQLSFCYSANRRSENPLQFYVTGFNGLSKKEMEKYTGYTNWDVHFREENYFDIFNKEDLVYLTSDSENVINTIEEDKVYIIGGLVDHNSHKGLCLKIAQERGIAHGRLPIKENIRLKTREVLTILHVYEIILLITEGKTWSEALLKVIPQRKGATTKSKECPQLEESKKKRIKLSEGSEIDEGPGSIGLGSNKQEEGKGMEVNEKQKGSISEEPV